MAYPGKDAYLIRRIQRAGLGKVRAAAMQQGTRPEQWAEDVKILRAVANSSPASAAQKCGIGRGAVWYRLTKYARIAETILDTKRERDD